MADNIISAVAPATDPAAAEPATAAAGTIDWFVCQ